MFKVMTHFGIICLAATGHLNTMFPLGRELQRRGHRVTIFSGTGAQTKAQAVGFKFYKRTLAKVFCDIIKKLTFFD